MHPEPLPLPPQNPHSYPPLLCTNLCNPPLPTLGYRGQFMLYAYYVCVAYLLRAISPPLAAMTAQEAALSGAFRCGGEGGESGGTGVWGGACQGVCVFRAMTA